MFQFGLSKLFVAVAIFALACAWVRLVMSGAFLAAGLSLCAAGLASAIFVGVWRDAGRLDKATIAALFFIAWTFVAGWATAVAFGVYASSEVGLRLHMLVLFPLALFLPMIAALLVFLARIWNMAWRDRLTAQARRKAEPVAAAVTKPPDQPVMKK